MLDIDVNDVFQIFSKEINRVFSGRLKSLYAYGSAVFGDLHIGYSDLDFFAVVSCKITQNHFKSLLEYRKALRTSNNKLFGMLEGEFVPETLLSVKESGNVAYWGTSGERMKNKYDLSGFSMRSLMDKGVSVYGKDVRSIIPYPTDEEMMGQVEGMISAVRKHATITNEDVHSADWLFLICQSLYWLKTGEITYKTRAAQWAKESFNEGWCAELDKAIWLRHHPDEAGSEENRRWLAGLGLSTQKAGDTLEMELNKYM